MYVGIGVPAVVGSWLQLAPNGGSHSFDRALGTFTTAYLAVIQDGRGPKSLGLVNVDWDINDAPQFQQLSDVAIVGAQAGDAIIFSVDDQQYENGPLLFQLCIPIGDGIAPIIPGLVGEPTESESDGKLLSVRVHTNASVGAISADILTAPFGGTFASIVGAGTFPLIADASLNQWYEDIDLTNWPQITFDVGTWFQVNVLTAGGGIASAVVSLEFQRTAQPLV